MRFTLLTLTTFLAGIMSATAFLIYQCNDQGVDEVYVQCPLICGTLEDGSIGCLSQFPDA
ncbi:hypothetical protein BJY04DRAFT_213525 [Aspergillus karnatakaensis]|uniref:uncharacterized protein n=1 Tax=Aspergillus karnatakaensis TaxID=1810916 RepID=UPI003CCDF054